MQDFNTIQKDFNGLYVDFIENDNELWLTSEQIGQALDYEDPRNGILKIYERNKDEVSECSGTVKLTAPGGAQNVRIYNEEGVMLITMLSKQPKAREFRRWAVQILKAYRHGILKKLMTQSVRKPDWEGLCIVMEKAGSGDQLSIFTLKDEGFSENGDIPAEYMEKPNLKIRVKLNAPVHDQNKWAINVYRHLGIPLPEQYQLKF